MGLNPEFIYSPVSVVAYPNPVSHFLTFEIASHSEERVLVDIFDLLGRRIERISDAVYQSGRHSINWFPDRKLRKGIYLYKIQIGTQTFSGRIILK